MTGNNITRFDYPHGNIFPTEYGQRLFHEWLIEEQKRFAEDNIKTRIVKDKEGREALVRI
jgi:hypothetical protein